MVGYAPPGNTDTAYRYFLEHGWTPAQAAGIVGNLMQESGPSLDPTIAGDGGAAYGIAQWNDRRPALFDWAQSGGRDPGDLQTQLDYIQHELGTTESRAADALRRAQTPQDAASAFLGFERPAGFSWSDPTGSHGYDNRVANALSLYGGGTMPQPMSSMPAGTAAGGQDMATGGLLGVAPAAPALQQSWLGGLLDIQPSEEQGLLGSIVNPQNQSDRQAVMQAAAAMLQASGPSTDPRGFGTSLAAGLQGYAQGQEFGAKQDENKLRAQARAQMEAMIASLPPEQQALARANPAAFSELMMQRQFAGPAAPINAGGGLFLDPTTMQPVADYRQPDAPPRPIVTDGGLVLSPDGTSVVGDYRQSERGINTAGLPTGYMWDPTGTQAVPIPGVPQTGPDLTALQQNLIAAGLTPGSPEFRQAVLAGTAGGTTINLDTAGAGGDPANISMREMQKGLGGALATQYQTMMDTGRAANLMLGDINQLEALLSQTPQGTLAPLGAQIGGLAKSVGIDIAGFDPSSAQAVNSIVARIVPALRPPGSGTTSDRDLALFQQSLPALSNTPQGNQAIVAVLRAMAERRVQEGQIATAVATGQLTPAKAQATLAGLGPYITPDLAATIAALSGQRSQGGPIDLTTTPAYQPGLQPAPAGAAPAAPMSPSGAPPIGTVDGGFRYMGGDPADPASWEPVQ